jgi:hypothetical protein
MLDLIGFRRFAERAALAVLVVSPVGVAACTGDDTSVATLAAGASKDGASTTDATSGDDGAARDAGNVGDAMRVDADAALPSAPIAIQILAINDFHGNMASATTSSITASPSCSDSRAAAAIRAAVAKARRAFRARISNTSPPTSKSGRRSRSSRATSSRRSVAPRSPSSA